MLSHSPVSCFPLFKSSKFLALLMVLATMPTGLQAQSSTVGQWSAVQTWPYRAVHTHLLPNGKVLSWSQFTEGDKTQIFDPATNSVTTSTIAPFNVFCAGHAFLPDGRLLVAGGHIADGVGLPHAAIFDFRNNSWSTLPDMNAGRWYPTNTTLANGDVLVLGGTIDAVSGNDKLPQIWQQSTKSWRNLTSALRTLPLYPRMFLSPNGQVFYAGPEVTTRYLSTSGTGAWTTVANTNFTAVREYAPVVMYDKGKIITIGGGDPPTNTAEVIDLNSSTPSWRFVGSMKFKRRQHNATILPDGKVLVTGGSSAAGFDTSTSPVLQAEMWDPATGVFTPMASFTLYRGYHSTAVLLPDGRVLSAGGKIGGINTAEIYSPPYLFNGARPTVSSAPSAVGYGQSFFVGTPNATSISKVTWIALSSVTHAFNATQRFQRLAFSQATGGLNVTSPASANNAPPGYYMLFLLNGSGVPSVAKIVKIAAGVPPPSGFIAGHVTRDDGLTAIPGATVSYSGGTATTDASGAYTLTNVPAGTVSLTASATGFQTQAKNASVTSGAQTTLDFALPASSGGTGNATVTGTVTSLSDGHALSGATVTYSGGSGVANSTGQYSIANVVPGTYNFTASQGGYLPRTNSVTVASGATTSSNFQLSTAGKIAGTTTTTAGAAISGVTVNISGGAIPTTVVLTTDATGHYLTNWIPRGNYSVAVSKTGLTSQSKPAAVSSGITTTVNFAMQ